MELQPVGGAPRRRDARPTGGRAWLRQVHVLLKKNWLLVLRNPRSTIIQLLCPILFMIFLYLIGLALRSSPDLDKEVWKTVRNPERRSFGSFPLCRTLLTDECFTFAYTPNNSSVVDDIVTNIRLKNDPPVPGLGEPFGIQGFATEQELDEYLLAHPNGTQAAYIFRFDESTIPRTYDWVLQFNSTEWRKYGIIVNSYELIQAPMYGAVSREILRIIGGNDSGIVRDVGFKNFPHPEVAPVPIISSAGSLFLLGAMMFNFVSLTSQTVLEKERRLRESMTQMGLYDSAYWLSWFVIQLAWTTYTTLALIATGAACQFNFFLNNNFGTYFLTFWLFGLTLVPLGFVINAIVRKSNSAAAVGFLVFLFSFVLLLVGGAIYEPNTAKGVQLVFGLFSPAMFSKGLNDLDYATKRDSDPGISWSRRSQYTNVWPLTSLWNGFIVDFFIYLLLALYLDNVVPNEYGVRKPLYYFVLPSYWCPSYGGASQVAARRPKRKEKSVDNNEQRDPKVVEEEERVWDAVEAGSDQSKTPLFVAGLRREYTSRKVLKCFRKKTFVAVNDLTFHIEPNQVTCLLGPNGAGKSTTISMLTGLVKPTGGDALIYGRSILNEMPRIRHDVGVCPQFEVYWEELSGREHLELFASIKGLPSEGLDAVVEEKLRQLAFREADMDALAVNYSGGMKRRLAVSIAFIGEPPIVFLDEPTTGMDPISKREVWKVIERAKSGRAIVLTTHSMEEADILADKIAIVTRGSLRVFDNPLSLKAARGSGYKLTLRTADTDAATARLIDWLRENAPREPDQQEPLRELTSFRGFVSFALYTAPSSAPALPAEVKAKEKMSIPEERDDEVEKDEKKSKKKRKAKDRAVSSSELPVEAIAGGGASTSVAARFFAHLETQREGLQIETMQISMGTLEEVFIRTVGGDEEQEKLDRAQAKKAEKKKGLLCCCKTESDKV